MSRYPYKAQSRAKRAARAESARSAQVRAARAKDLAPIVHAAREVTFVSGYVSAVGAAMLAAIEREGL